MSHKVLLTFLSFFLFFHSAVSAAKDAAGNVDLQKIQQLREMGDALLDEPSKKDD